MAIIVGGTVVDPLSLAAKVQEERANPHVVPVNPIVYVKGEARDTSTDSKHYVMVNGQAKHITKKSAYLLDMLTTD